MRKVAAFAHMSLDGYAAGATGMGLEFTGRAYSDELTDFHDTRIRPDIGTAVYGRKTFIGMRDHWTSVPGSPDASEHDLEHAAWVTGVDKLVFSTTLKSAGWANTRIIATDALAQVEALKAEDGGVLAIYGSPTLTHWFTEQGLVDELRVFIHPITIGAGTPLFQDKTALDLNLLESKTFDSGAVYVRYQVA
ncbi:dihydrofolate reductase family protein [Nocardia sp. NPDC020380]|uniref:dihydrofolate reductase family protein n=1 Tax=Nocardia sp. NPDC020380 TaxID=3364309 RepID=UPI0037B59FCA